MRKNKTSYISYLIDNEYKKKLKYKQDKNNNVDNKQLKENNNIKDKQ